ncbi:MAG: hypothetical protein P8Z30_13295 [Acidobacteriota bacterium]
MNSPERKRVSLCFAQLLAILVAGCIAGSASQGKKLQTQHTQPINSLQNVIDDMTLPHQGRPMGVPDSYDWSHGPVMGRGNHPPATWHAITAWGQLYVDAKGNPARNTRVEIRRMQTYILSKRDGKWHRVQNSEGVEGAAFREDFAKNISRKPDVRHEPDGSVSVTAGGGYNFHFWPTDGRASIDPREVAGVFVTVEARLIVSNPNRPDDRSGARYLLSVGADYWVNRHAAWNHFKTNDAVAMGRFKYVTMTPWPWAASNTSRQNGRRSIAPR